MMLHCDIFREPVIVTCMIRLVGVVDMDTHVAIYTPIFAVKFSFPLMFFLRAMPTSGPMTAHSSRCGFGYPDCWVGQLGVGVGLPASAAVGAVIGPLVGMAVNKTLGLKISPSILLTAFSRAFSICIITTL